MTVERAPDWLREDLVRGMPHFITPAWVRDRSLFDAKATVDALETIGFKVLHFLTKHHDGYMLWPSAHAPDNQPDRDYFGEQVDECVKRGIRVIAYYSVGLDNWAGGQHPEWLVRDQHGDLPDTSGWNSPTWMCLNSGYADFAWAQLDELARKYPLNGFWLDICGLPVNENFCFCDSCRRAFTAWAGPANLDNMKGSDDMWEFKLHVHREFVHRAREILREHRRDPVVLFNGAGAPYNKRYAQAFEGADSESSECHDPILVGTIGRINRNTGKPFELLSCSETTWGHPVLKPDTLVELEAFAAVAQGGTYTVGITQTPQGWLSPGNIERLARISARVRAQRDVLIGTEPIYDVGVVSPWDDREMRRVMPQVWRWVDFMRQGHFLFNVLPGFRHLEAQRVVVIPGGLRIDEGDAELLRDYVEGGGSLVVEAPTWHRHADGPYLLEDLLGVHYQGRSPAGWHYLQPTHAVLRQDGMTHDPLMVPSPADHVTLNGAEQIGTLVHQFVPMDLAHTVWTQANVPEREPVGEPGITVNQVGQGRVAFVVGQLSARDPKDDTNPWTGTLAQNLVDQLLDGRTLDVQAGPLVEVVANRQGQRVILHLLNHAYGPSPSLRDSRRAGDMGSAQTTIHSRGEIDRTAPLAIRIDVERLDMRPGSARLAPDGEALELQADGDTIELTAPSLGVQQIIVLE